MRNVVFIAPFPLETTMRFVRAVGGLADVKLLGVLQETPRGEDAALYWDVVRVEDALDAAELVRGVELLRQRHGQPHRILGILEPLQVPLAMVRRPGPGGSAGGGGARRGGPRRAGGVPGPDGPPGERSGDRAHIKAVRGGRGGRAARHKLLTTWADAEAFVAEVGLPIVLK